MAKNNQETGQFTLNLAPPPAEPDPRQFTCPSEAASFAVYNSGRSLKAVAIDMRMSESLLCQKLRGESARLSCDEYDRLAEVLGDGGNIMHKYYAVKLLPKPGRKEILWAEKRKIRDRETEIDRELERL